MFIAELVFCCTAKMVREFKGGGTMALRKIRHLRPQQTSLNARKPVEPEGMVTRMDLLKEDISYKPIQIKRETQ